MRASYWQELSGNSVKCTLCPNFCVISSGKRGRCGVRNNNNGILEAEQWGKLSAIAVDPIEKKPLYHFLPGTEILSLGGFGCNLSCLHCQNWNISTTIGEGYNLLPQDVVNQAVRHDLNSIAFTYNEPFINFEYYLEVCRLAQARGIKTVFVTNGYINPEPLEEIIPYIDAANVDLKGMTENFYEHICSASLAPIQQSIVTLASKVHTELTCLVIPTKNDSDEDFEAMANWIAENCSPSTPLHISAYFPAHMLRVPPTPVSTLRRGYEILSRRLKHVYVGNVRSQEWSDTKCVKCSFPVIIRRGYSVDQSDLVDGCCSNCGICRMNWY